MLTSTAAGEMGRLGGIAAVLGLSACTTGPTGVDSTPGCLSSEAIVDPVMATRILVNWTTEAPGRSWVEFGDGATTTPTEDASGEHSAALLGMGADAEISWTAYTETAEGVVTCEGTAETGPLPNTLPTLTIRAPDVGRVESPWVAMVLNRVDVSVLAVVDREGRIVWYREGDTTERWIDVAYDEELAQLTWNHFGGEGLPDDGQLITASLAGGEERVISTPLSHHSFTPTPEGFAWIRLDVRDWLSPDGDEYSVGGDEIVTLDLSTGEERTIFSTWDSFVPVVRDGWVPHPSEAVADWTHGNGLRYSETEDAFVFSTPSLARILVLGSEGQIRADVGNLNARLRADPPLRQQHSPMLTPEGDILVFTTNADGLNAGARQYHLSPERSSAQSVWDYGYDLGLAPAALGQGTRLPGGNTLVDFGLSGVLHEVDADGELLWGASTDMGWTFGNAAIVPNLYPTEG